MIIACSPYTLQFKSAPNSQQVASEIEGYLLRIQFDEGVSYSVLQTWPSLGERSVHESLRSLLSEPDRHILHAINVAQKFGQQFLWSDKTFQKSIAQHFLMPVFESEVQWEASAEEAQSRGFQKFKFKLGQSPREEAAALNHWAEKFQRNSWRFDFNTKGTTEFLKHFDARWDDRVELVEDPYALNPFLWNSLQQRRSWSLFADRHKPDVDWDEKANPQISAHWDFVSGYVIKPITESLILASGHRRVLFTSNMDHALGHWIGLCLSCSHEHSFVLPDYGFQSIELLKTDAFTEVLKMKNNHLPIDFKAQWSAFEGLLNRLSWEVVTNDF